MSRRRRLDVYEDRLADKVTARVVAALRDILRPHDTAISSGTREERTCPEDETNDHGSSDLTGSKARNSGALSRSTLDRLRKEIDAEIDTLATRRKRTRTGS
jgi:hypothetical protein